MPEYRHLIPIGLASLAATPALAQEYCTVRDVSHEEGSDCYLTTWHLFVNYSYQTDKTGTVDLGSLQGGSVCEPANQLKCDGTLSEHKLYKATKQIYSWPSTWAPDTAYFTFNVGDQYLSWESCFAPNGEAAWNATNYTFTHSGGWYQIWCD